jgi:hypothetical protein
MGREVPRSRGAAGGRDSGRIRKDGGNSKETAGPRVLAAVVNFFYSDER